MLRFFGASVPCILTARDSFERGLLALFLNLLRDQATVPAYTKNSHLLKRGLLLWFFLCSANLVWAQETSSVQQNKTEKKLIQPEKMTVGPFDNYQSTIAPGQEVFFYTQNVRLSSLIFKQKLKDAHPEEAPVQWSQDNYDTKDPSLSPDGQWLAYTSFLHHARGQVCYKYATPNTAPEYCVNQTPTEAPFWINAQTLGYILKDEYQKDHQIIAHDITTHRTRVLVTDAVLSASINPTQDWLAYGVYIQDESSKEVKRVIKLYHLKRAYSIDLKLELPGHFGFPQFSADNQYLYFVQYLKDTNGDQTVDANDHSIIVRVPMSVLESGKPINAEQLTSLEHNCNFPSPSKDWLFMTCAFDNALDIYRLPLSGMVPSAWTLADLEQALQSARTYEERLLLMNQKKIKFKTSTLETQIDDDLMLGDLILAHEYNASLFYVSQIIKQANDVAKKERGILLQVLLQAWKESQTQNFLERTEAFKSHMRDLLLGLREQAQVKTNQAIHALVKSQLQYYTGDTALSFSTFFNLKAEDITPAFESAIYFEIAQQLFVPDLDKESQKHFNDAFYLLVKNNTLNEQSQVFYAFMWLQRVSHECSDMIMRQARIQNIMAQLSRSSHAYLLFQNELLALQMVALKQDKEAQKSIYEQLNQQLITVRPFYFLKKAMLTRAIIYFAQHELWKYMAYLASTWISTTYQDNTEYAYARQQYLDAVYDRAYGLVSLNKPQDAADLFYTAARLTDDLESHHGYVKNTLKANMQLAPIEQEYKKLMAQNFTHQNFDYVRALLLLLPLSPGTSMQRYTQAQALLMHMQSAEKEPMRHLLLGYLYQQQMMQLKKGQDYDDKLAQKAHHHYLIAADLSRSNKRILATLYWQLGTLHAHTQNYGLASDYLSQRNKYPFESKEQQISFLWTYARALYAHEQSKDALAQIEQALVLQKQTTLSVFPLLERAGFYALYAGLYEQSKGYYEQLLAAHKMTDLIQTIKIQTAYGFSLFKLQENKMAYETFAKILLLTQTEAFNQQKQKFPYLWRYVLYAQQVLGQLARTPEEAMVHHQANIDVLLNIHPWLSQIMIKQDGWFDYLIMHHHHLALASFKNNQKEVALATMDRALLLLKKYESVHHTYIGPAFYQTIKNTFTLLKKSHHKITLHADILKDLSQKTLNQLKNLAADSDVIQQKFKSLEQDYQSVFGAFHEKEIY